MSHLDFFHKHYKSDISLSQREKKRTQRTQSEASSTSDFVLFVVLGAFSVKIMSLWNCFENS
jgi:hypothetical protein